MNDGNVVGGLATTALLLAAASDYAIVDEAMIREAAIKMNRGAKTRRATAQRAADSASTVQVDSPV